MASKILLKGMERNAGKSMLELTIYDPETKETVRLVRSEDIHGDEQAIRVKLADGSRITGIVNMGKYKRVSDLFAYGKRFQPVYAATTDGLEGKILFVNKDQVVWAEEV